MNSNVCVHHIGEYSEKKFEKILKQTYFEAIRKEIDNLREWYFYEDKHSQFNEEYYIFVGKLCDGKLSVDERLNLAINMFRRAYQYMCLFYPTAPKLDVDLLTEPSGEEMEAERQLKELEGLKKKVGRPKGSKNKKSKGKKKNASKGRQTKAADTRSKTSEK